MEKILICSAGHETDNEHPFNRHKKAGDKCGQLISYNRMDGGRYCKRRLREKNPPPPAAGNDSEWKDRNEKPALN